MKLTNVHKHFGLMLLLGILAWAEYQDWRMYAKNYTKDTLGCPMSNRLLNKLRTSWTICGIVITNTFIHLIVGLAFGLSGFIAKLIPELVIMIPIGMFIGTVGWEMAQAARVKEDLLSERMRELKSRLKANASKGNLTSVSMHKILIKKLKKQFWAKWNWIDSIVDVIAGNLGFHLVYWIIWFFA